MPDDLKIFMSFLRKMSQRKSFRITPFSFKISPTDEIKTSFLGWTMKNGIQYGVTYFKDSDSFSFQAAYKDDLNDYTTESRELSNEEVGLLPPGWKSCMKQVADSQQIQHMRDVIAN